jgi:uncharacterized membrane protein HdeD (DUF308 family)
MTHIIFPPPGREGRTRERTAKEGREMNGVFKASIGNMIFTAIVGIILGIILLVFPLGTTVLMGLTLELAQLFLSVFILYYAISESVQYFKAGKAWAGFAYIGTGILATLFVWIFNVSVIYWFVAFFLILTGVGEIFGAFQVYQGSFFLAVLGVLNIFVGIAIVKYPAILNLIIAWYILFWGISRLALAMELRKIPSA